MPTITISEATAAELRAFASVIPAGLSSMAKAELLSVLGAPPIVTPPTPPVTPPAIPPTGMPISLPANGNRDYPVNLAPGATINAWFVMPDVVRPLNLGWMYNSGATNLRTFELRIGGVPAKPPLRAKSVSYAIGPGQIHAPTGSVVELRVTNAVNGTPTGAAGNSSGFFQIQRPA